MEMSRKSMVEFLVDEKLITREQLDSALKNRSRFKSRRMTQLLIEMELVSEEALKHALAKHTQVAEINLQSVIIKPEVINLIHKNIAEKYLVIPVELDQGNLTLAISDPYDVYAIEAVEIISGYHPNLVLATRSDIINAINRHYGESADASKDEASDFTDIASEVAIEPVTEEEPESDLKELVEEKPLVIRLVKSFMSEAVRMNASDIHIEPREDYLAVRYRIDGVLKQILTILYVPSFILQSLFLSGCRGDRTTAHRAM